jgi:hypothetical protein
MSLHGKLIGAAAALALTAGAPAFAAVFAEKSPAQKLRADVAKQVAGYTKCLVTAVLNCEKTGISPSPECDLESATAAAPADPKGKLAPAIAKCDAKLDYDRKGPKGNSSVENYELIGCPTGSNNRPRFADMDEFEGIASRAKREIDAIASVVPAVSGCTDTEGCIQAAKVIASYAAAFGRCQTSCENDYKDKKGDGGPDDDPLRCGPTGDPAAVACIDKAADKFVRKTATWSLADAVRSAVEATIDTQTDALFNVPPNCF